jgi:hypothetical protein
MKGSIAGMTTAFFRPGEIDIAYDDNNADKIGRIKYGSYIDRSGTHRKLCVTDGNTSGIVPTYLKDKNQVIRKGICKTLTRA